jgi:hypothetical protein
MFASLGFLAERFQETHFQPLRIETGAVRRTSNLKAIFSTGEHVHGCISTDSDDSRVQITLKGSLRLLQSAAGSLLKPILTRTILEISQEIDLATSNTFDFPSFALDGLPSSLSFLADDKLHAVELQYQIEAVGQDLESSEAICFIPLSTAPVRALTTEILPCTMNGLRKISPLCSREGLPLRIEVSTENTLIFPSREENASSRVLVKLCCDDADDYPGTVHADMEWSLSSLTTVPDTQEDHVLRSIAVPARRNQVRWTKWTTHGLSWSSEASVWMTIPRALGLAPSFNTPAVSHAHSLSVQLRLSTLAEQPRLSRIFNIEPEVLVMNIPITVAYVPEAHSRVPSPEHLGGYATE